MEFLLLGEGMARLKCVNGRDQKPMASHTKDGQYGGLVIVVDSVLQLRFWPLMCIIYPFSGALRSKFIKS